ncbi:Glyoxylate/succinic semialdehyde reductase 1 [Colletotrichum sp. SAR 10_70]|nr:Glyoxylate/succinic semialdehyde reductase 1 [Colletotrichum sp. SAR 10_71]KAI8182400.1 Glyoxylate/succinic semialdehyde reductase 1 [Colletotrichum sp. SAR 10_70]KAI8209425.1 Glyoxylate/succinic semialdehyde reductase 1 [Colletotrichum sp. SAR 10_76]KAI8236774.1 Glyoxylate/succinic semialdehyde reductase 1 [Colletotrichum sp. SAR 10_86]KAI8258485.1 Glyoxylate/succinic semialdehyde reductase 1 [Colletotrichum sp. SAR 10_77]KAJ5001802.1 Glyoxylate/succinic semialdehyde reductase 1 [Colletotr
MRVGFLGLGVMGTPMALNLTRKFPVTVWNRTASKYPPLTKAGAKIGETPAKVVEQSDVIFTMLFDDAALTSIFNDDFRGALRGKTLINTASIPVDISKHVAEQVQRAGGNFIEMPVSGSKIPAEQGRLVGLLAGDPKIAEQMRPYVEPLTAAAIYCGPIGFGLKTKYAVNLYLNNMTAALAESFSLAKAQGLNLEAFGQVIDAGPMASAYTKVKIPKLVNNDWAPQAAVKDCYNSTQMIVKAAEDANVRTPYAELCREVYKEATEAGLNEEDMIAVYKLFQNPR